MTDALEAAQRWADTWQRAWPARDADAIAALYRTDAAYRSSPFGPPEPGGAAAYLHRQFAEESAVQCRFDRPVVTGARAAVSWWASWVEAGETLTLAGTTMLRFAADGLVVDHVDYWLQAPGRQPPYEGWES